jgi:hypothetical protein
MLAGCKHLAVECTEQHVDKDERCPNNDVKYDPPVGDVQPKVGYHGADKPKDTWQLRFWTAEKRQKGSSRTTGKAAVISKLAGNINSLSITAF